jgi:hypothetical protein
MRILLHARNLHRRPIYFLRTLMAHLHDPRQCLWARVSPYDTMLSFVYFQVQSLTFVGHLLSLACTEACVEKLLNTVDCSPIDNHCYCSNNDYLRNLGKCVCSTCGSVDIQTSVLVGSQVCLLAVRLYFTTS